MLAPIVDAHLRRHARHVYEHFFTAHALADELGGGEILKGGWFMVVAA